MVDANGDFRALQYRFAAHLRDPAGNAAPDGIDDRRLAIYRDLFFNNVVSLLAGNFPVLRSLHDETGWRDRVRYWYAEHRAHTPLFPEIGREFVRWLQTSGERDHDLPTWFAELAHYEWMEVVARDDEADITAIDHDPDGDLLDGRPLVSPLVWPLSYRHAVHRIRADAVPGNDPPTASTCLIVARDRQDRVGFLETNPLTLHLIEQLRLHPERRGRDNLLALASDAGVDPAMMLQGGAAILAQLRERDIILGTRP
jgi:hypothetical protein